MMWSPWWASLTGIVAQIRRHKPSATAEKYFTVRPHDLLRLHHDKIEAWVLGQAGVPFVRQAVQGQSARSFLICPRQWRSCEGKCRCCRPDHSHGNTTQERTCSNLDLGQFC